MNLKKARKMRQTIRKELRRAMREVNEMPFKDRLWFAWKVICKKEVAE